MNISLASFKEYLEYLTVPELQEYQRVFGDMLNLHLLPGATRQSMRVLHNRVSFMIDIKKSI